jgi:type I restriction enzyme S subunit
LSDADAWIESLEQLIAKKRRIKEGSMQALLTAPPSATPAMDNGDAGLPEMAQQLIMDNGQATEPSPNSQLSTIHSQFSPSRRLPGFSGEWEVKLLPEVSRFRGGKAHEQFISEHGRFVCVNSKFISSEGQVRKYSTANFCCAKAKDILMVMSDLPNGKALAKVFLVDKDDMYAINQRVCALSAHDDYSAEFLSYILNRNPYFLKFDDGVSQTHLLNRVFEKCPLKLPPTKAEQIAIAAILSNMDTEIDALQAKLRKARQIKQGMMQELLTGKTRLV